MDGGGMGDGGCVGGKGWRVLLGYRAGAGEAEWEGCGGGFWAVGQGRWRGWERKDAGGKRGGEREEDEEVGGVEKELGAEGEGVVDGVHEWPVRVGCKGEGSDGCEKCDEGRG